MRKGSGSIRRLRTWQRATHIGVAPLDFGEGELHTFEYGSLNVEHGRRERLIKLDDVGLAFLQVVVDVVVEAARDRVSFPVRSLRHWTKADRGRMMTSRSLSCTSVVCKGEMPNVNASGRSENAFKKPIFTVRRYSISADALRRLKVPEGTHLVVTAVEVDDE